MLPGLLCLALLGGCATRTPSPAMTGAAEGADAPAEKLASHWQGRLSVKVWSKPVQAFTANFDLQGTALVGRLELSTVLGSMLARMEWNPEGAQLETSAKESPGAQHFASLDAMARQALGVDIPVGLFFGWLQGSNTPHPDWSADTSLWQTGRITAKRSAEPQAELVIVLDP